MPRICIHCSQKYPHTIEESRELKPCTDEDGHTFRYVEAAAQHSVEPTSSNVGEIPHYHPVPLEPRRRK